MKIAICFSGQIRTGVTCAPNILRYIGDLLPQCDFFVHTWDIESDVVFNNARPAHQPFLVDKQLFADFYNVYKPLKMTVEPYFLRKVSPKWDGMRVNPDTGRDITALFETIYEANLLKKQHEEKHKFKYDIVVRIRPDLIFRHDKSLREDISLIEHDRMFITANHLGMWGEKHLEDILWIGNSLVLDSLADFYHIRQNSVFEGITGDRWYLDWQSHQAQWVLKGLGFHYKSCTNNNMRIYYRVDERNGMDVMDPPFGPGPRFGGRPEEFK